MSGVTSTFPFLSCSRVSQCFLSVPAWQHSILFADAVAPKQSSFSSISVSVQILIVLCVWGQRTAFRSRCLPSTWALGPELWSVDNGSEHCLHKCLEMVLIGIRTKSKSYNFIV